MQHRTVTASGLYAFVTSNVTLVACVSLAQAQVPAVRIVPATPVQGVPSGQSVIHSSRIPAINIEAFELDVPVGNPPQGTPAAMPLQGPASCRCRKRPTLRSSRAGQRLR